MDIKCYFYIAENKVKAMCSNCYEDHKQGWMWNYGFGEKQIKCSICDKIINKISNNV